MKVANPNSTKPFDSETETHGYRMVDGVEEIVDKRSGKSNMDYFTPEQQTFYENCMHKFRITSLGKREVECVFCHLFTSFHPAVNFKEESGKAWLRLRDRDYEIVL